MQSVDSRLINEASLAEDRLRVLSLIRQHGRFASAFQALEEGYTYWFWSDDDGHECAVAYLVTGGFAVVVGQPIVSQDRLCMALSAFRQFSESNGWRVLLAGVEEWALSHFGSELDHFDIVKIGEQPEWDCQNYTIEGAENKTLRAQINRAKNKNVSIQKVQALPSGEFEGTAKLAIRHVMKRWMDARPIGILKFMVSLEPFSFANEKRYFLALHGGQPVGFLAAVPVYGRQGWFFEDVIRTPDAPNGTSELLIHTAMIDVQSTGSSFATLGLAPLARLSTDSRGASVIGPFGYKMLNWVKGLYDFDGLYRFKGRFNPHRWVPQYLLKTRETSGVKATAVLLKAFAPKSTWAFLFDSFRRLLARVTPQFWSLLLAVQCLILILWTGLLANVDGSFWFGDQSIQVAWIVFNSLLATGLFSLSALLKVQHATAPRLSMFLAGATLTDFVLSTVQAISLHGQVEGWTAVFVSMGILGPAIATVILWCISIGTARRTLRR
ncbi:MAG: DUF2156 domain-containing protein [Myxococcota bacterium]|nr:DUF2156 domain-containing protein [Myxococcota bacterium]